MRCDKERHEISNGTFGKEWRTIRKKRRKFSFHLIFRSRRHFTRVPVSIVKSTCVSSSFKTTLSFDLVFFSVVQTDFANIDRYQNRGWRWLFLHIYFNYESSTKKLLRWNFKSFIDVWNSLGQTFKFSEWSIDHLLVFSEVRHCLTMKILF